VQQVRDGNWQDEEAEKYDRKKKEEYEQNRERFPCDAVPVVTFLTPNNKDAGKVGDATEHLEGNE
jgi:hypothetical protein